MEVTLTEKDRSIIEKYETVRFQKQDHALSPFSDDDKSRFLSLLREYVQNCIAQEINIDLICLQCNGVIGDKCSLGSDRQRCRFYYKIRNKITTNEEEY